MIKKILSPILKVPERTRAYYKNIQYTQKNKIKILAGIAILYYCGDKFNQNYYRKYKGIRKIQNIYKPEDSEKEMVVFHDQFLHFLFGNPLHPVAVLYPQRIESLQKMLKMCNKYFLNVVNSDYNYQQIEEQEQTKHHVYISQKNMKEFEFNQKTQSIKVGPGWRLCDLNEKLKEYGYILPINKLFNDQRLFQIFNEDQAFLDNRENFQLKELVKSATFVMADGKTICIDKKLGIGMDLSGVFIGSQAMIGLLAQISLKVEKINKIQKLQAKLENNQSKFIEILQNFQNLQNSGPQYLRVDEDDNLYIQEIIKSDQNLKNKEILFGNDKLILQQIPNLPTQQENYQTHFHFIFHLSDEKMLKQLRYLNEQIHNLKINKIFEKISYKYNFSSHLFSIKITSDQKNLELENNLIKLKNIFANITNKGAQYIYCNNQAINSPFQFGMINYNMQHQIKQYFDPNKILQNNFFLNHDLLEN